MREDTHVVMGAGVSSAAASLLGCSIPCLVLAVTLNSIIHPLIDWLGHEKHWWQSHPRRHAITHSLLGSSILSLAVVAVVVRLLSAVGIVVDAWSLSAATLAGALSHLALDALNPSGVFVCGRRVSLRIARYNNPILNIAFQAMGLMLLVYSVMRVTGA